MENHFFLDMLNGMRGGVSTLNVLVFHDDGSWFAQGLELDYAAEAKALDHLRTRFEDGLAATVLAHEVAFKGLTNLTQPAPDYFWRLARERLLDRHLDSASKGSPAKVVIPEVLPFGRFTYRQVMLPSPGIESKQSDYDDGSAMLSSEMVLHLLQERGVHVTRETGQGDPSHAAWGVRATILSGLALEVQLLPLKVHRRMLQRLARRFGTTIDELLEEANVLFNRALAGLQDVVDD
jgi:hypothetical protein